MKDVEVVCEIEFEQFVESSWSLPVAKMRPQQTSQHRALLYLGYDSCTELPWPKHYSLPFLHIMWHHTCIVCSKQLCDISNEYLNCFMYWSKHLVIFSWYPHQHWMQGLGSQYYSRSTRKSWHGSLWVDDWLAQDLACKGRLRNIH